jgi:CxxC motif-containing protein (DUF1111 family)
MILRRTGTLFILLAATLASQNGLVPGDPLPGITPQEFEKFQLGLEDFTEVETAQDGLGPAFNGNSCAQCHATPAIGGIAAMTEVRAGYRDDEGVFHELRGTTLFPLFSIPPHLCQVTMPPEANVIARRAPIPLFGAGLIEAIPDETLLALEDPDDRDNDGISGRAARIEDLATRRQRIGRFGWKSQQATLLAFSGDAYRNEMGITNDLFPQESAPGISPETLRLCAPKQRVEDVRDRRTGMRGIDNFENFMKFLAPIPRGPVNDTVRRGEALFQAIGCANCHVPQLTTGVSSNPVFDRKIVALFSDLLLHDIGTGDGIPQASATEAEIKTPALWGLRLRRPLMHDGASPTPKHAIERHAGEASRALSNYHALSDGDQAAFQAFLDSL